MKVIDLLNKIAKEGKQGVMFKYKNKIYCATNMNYDFWELDNDESFLLENKGLNCLNDEIELIEEEKKIELPEKIEIPKIEHKDNQRILNVEIKLNGLIDYLKYKEEKEKEV